MSAAARNFCIQRTQTDDSSTEPDATFKVLEPRVGSERIKPRPKEDAGVESILFYRVLWAPALSCAYQNSIWAHVTVEPTTGHAAINLV